MPKKMTIENLAVMVNKGFKETATKQDVKDLQTDMDARFEEVNRRFDKIEERILEDHKNRIERLEEDMKELRGLLKV